MHPAHGHLRYVVSALETFVIIALYKSTFTIPYHTYESCSVKAPGTFGGYSPGALGTEVPQWGPGTKPRQGVWGTKLKQFADMVYVL